MNKKLVTFFIEIPDKFTGAVTSELHNRGAWIDSVRNNDSHITLEVRAEGNLMLEFDTWLNDLTKGDGQIDRKPSS